VIDILGWIGAGLLSLAPFIVAKYPRFFVFACITGLALLIPQAITNNLWNLVALNSIGIVGYFWSLRK
jgi:hypothetical protein